MFSKSWAGWDWDQGWPAVSRKWQLPGQRDTVCSKSGSHSRTKDANHASSVGKRHWACSVTPADQRLHSLVGISPRRDSRGTLHCFACCAEKKISFAFLSFLIFSHSISMWKMQYFLLNSLFCSHFKQIHAQIIVGIIFWNHLTLCLFVKASVSLCTSVTDSSVQRRQ